MSPTYRRILKLARTVHVHLTLFGLALILFFAITGFMLNHEEWFGLNEPRTRIEEGTLPAEMVKPVEEKPVDKLAVVEALRKDFGATGAMDSFHDTESDLEVIFLRPGLRVVAEVQRDDGKTKVTFYSSGASGLITDLHKGKSAGAAWGIVIDGVCILLLAISLSGLVLWSALKSRGKWGATAMSLGLAIGLVVYYVSVP
jgi:hypothetical protein